MAVAGTLTYKTEVDQSGIQKGLNKTGGIIKGVLGGLGIAKAVSVAMNSIRSSIDGATKRIDTLNNFPKVMKNFGVSADEASESVKRIDQSVRGLPTSLDQAVAGVQDLFMVTKDLKQSEQLFKAVNDSAMVFANGSTEAVDRFIYGYKQALSAGKISAQDFNQMNEAIPGLMSKVAEKTGVTYKELKEGLSNGSISIDEFNEALKSLDTEGVGSMEALEVAAKTSTGGIQTSIANMKTAITRGVAEIITSIDKSLSSFGGISGVMTAVGKKAEEVLKMIADNMPQIMQMLPVITGVFGALKIGLPLLDTLGGLLDLLPGKFGLITKILGGLAIGGGLIAGLGSLTTVFGEKINKLIVFVSEKAPEILTKFATAMVNSLPILLQKGQELISVILNFINTNAPMIINMVMGVIVQLANSMIQMLPQILQVIITIITQVAIALGKQLPTLIPVLIKGLIDMVMTIIDNIDKFIDAGIELILGLAMGLIEAIPLLLEKLPEIITKLVLKLTEPEMLMKIIEAAIILIQSLAKGLIQAIPQLLLAVPKIIVNIFNGLRDRIKNTNWLELGKNILKTTLNGMLDIARVAKDAGTLIINVAKSIGSKIKNTNWLELGKNILRGILNGMLNFGSLVKNTVAKMGSKIVNDIKSFFKIKSPSKIMEDEVGQWLPKGIAVGITANTDSILDTLDDMYKEMDTAIQEENGKLSLNSVSGDIYNKTIYSTPDIINENTLLLDGEVVYENQQKVSARKNLQTQFGGAYSVSN